MNNREFAALELDAETRRERGKLSDIAFALLSVAGGDQKVAENLLDDFVGLICESGVLSTWRYRILLELVREGL